MPSTSTAHQTQLVQELRELLAAVFGKPVQEVPVDASLGGYKPWDSLGHVEIIMGVETRFGVRVPSSLLGELVTLDLIAEFLREQGGNKRHDEAPLR
jgi:acyl carrier protein